MSEFVPVVSTMTCGGRERQRRKVTQTISTMMGDPVAQNVHVGKSTENVHRIQ